MRNVFLLLFSFSVFFCQAQDYRLIGPNRINFYKYSDKIHSVRIDSIETIATDSIFYNYKIWDFENPWNVCVEYRDTNFFMDRIILKSNGDHITFNENEDSILIKSNSNLGSQWILYKYPNGNRLNATVISILPSTYLGSPDSIKTIELQTTNSVGNPITGIFDGKQIKIGKNNGLIKFYNTLNFPTDTTAFILQGKSNPQVGDIGITYSEIKNWNIGDIFHYSGSWNNGSGDAMYNYELLTIAGKTISVTGDTIVYTKERKYYQKYINPWPNVQVTYNQNTVQETIINSAPNNMNNLSYESYIDTVGFEYSGYNYKYVNPTFPGKRMIKDFPQFLYNGSCVGTPTGQCIWFENDYLEGIGLFKEDHGGGPDCYVKNLVYYSKGTETWGTPINWQTLLSIESSVQDDILSVFPNPSNGKFSISTSFDSFRLEIIDIFGKTIHQSEYNGINTYELDLTSQPNGFYLLKISNENGSHAFTKLIKD